MKNLSFSDLGRFFSRFRYGAHLRPARDWLLILGTAVVLVIASLVWNLWTFTKVTEGDSIGSQTASTTPTAPHLENITSLFNGRAAEVERYRTEYQFVDPSTRGR